MAENIPKPTQEKMELKPMNEIGAEMVVVGDGAKNMQEPDKMTKNDGQKDEKVEDGKAYADKGVELKMESTIGVIIAENSADFKDFQFPVEKLNILFNRLYLLTKNRLEALGADKLAALGVETGDLVKLYRNHYNKKGDIKFLTDSYTSIGNGTEATEKAGVKPDSTQDEIEDIQLKKTTDQLVKKPVVKKFSGERRRSVRFKTPERFPRNVQPESKEEKREEEAEAKKKDFV